MSKTPRRIFLGRNPIHRAIRLQNLGLLDDLLSSPGSNINEQNQSGETPLLYCLKLRRPDQFVELLLKYKCDATITDKDKITPLSIAFRESRTNIINQLISAGADILATLRIIYADVQSAVEDESWDRIYVFVSHYPNFILAFLSILETKGFIPRDRLDFFHKLGRLDNYLNKDRNKRIHNYVGINLLEYSMELYRKDVFLYCLEILDHEYVLEKEPRFLEIYIESCQFWSRDFLAGIASILLSDQGPDFFACYRNEHEFFFEDFLKRFLMKGLNEFNETSVKFLWYCKIIRNESCYRTFDEYNTELTFGLQVLVILNILRSRKLMTQQQIISQIIRFLEKYKFIETTDNFYLELIMMKEEDTGQEWLFHNKVTRNTSSTSTRVIIKIPSLLEISNFMAGICLWNYYKIENKKQLKAVFDYLIIPETLKRKLWCHLSVWQDFSFR